MDSPEDMSDKDRDSEFDSEEENMEFQLYQQLYFEPNPDVETDTVSKSSTPGQHERNGPETRDKQFAQLDGRQPHQLRNPKHVPSTPTTAPKIRQNQTPQIEDCIYIDTAEGAELSLVDLTAQQNKKQTKPHASTSHEVLVIDNVPRKKNSVSGDQVSPIDNTQNHPQQTELDASAGQEVSVNDNAPIKSNVLPLQSVRERLSSTCSDGSIPGKVPLDDLYCNLVTIDEDDDDITIIKDRLVIKDLNTNNQEKKKENKANSNKRKRRKSNSDDEAEDSRCNSLISAALKPAVSKGDTDLQGYDSNSDDDIYILPPPDPKDHEILTIESSSDNEMELGSRDANSIRTKNNKKRKIEPAQTSTSRKDGKSKAKHQVSGSAVKQRRKEDKGWESLESESDTNDVDLPEATKGTDLILNIDKSLTGWVKTITKDPVTPKKTKKATPKKPYDKNNRPTLDYTKGRPDTTTKPSCEKWTQSMANFYDSDVSEDLDVMEVLSQQTDSAAQWKLVADDYQVTKRRRYYNAPERCKRCKQEGHTTNKCPRVPVCHMCSEKDHANRRDCPQNCCFRCGGDPHVFCHVTHQACVCHLCGFPGHRKELCPDLWRRFHLTTSGLVAQPPSEDRTIPSGQRYCFNCAKRGHYGYECTIKFQNNQFYPHVSQSVVSYCCPVNFVDGRLVVNVDGTQPTPQEKNVTSIPIKPEDVGRIIGKRGAVVKLIIKDSGAHVRVIQEGEPKIMLSGPPEAQLKAQEIIKGLTKKKNDGWLEFVKLINNSGSSVPTTSTSLTVDTNRIVRIVPGVRTSLLIWIGGSNL